MKRLTIEDLMVVEFKPEAAGAETLLRREMPGVLKAESCAWHVYYGHKNDFDSIPGNADLFPEYKSGADAYAYLATLAAGVYNKELDTHDRNQFRARYEKKIKKDPWMKSTASGLVDDIYADIKLIDELFLSGYKVPRHGLTACSLADIKKNDQSVLVMDINKDGGLMASAKGILHVLSTHRTKHASRLYVTNPQSRILGQVKEQIDKIAQQQKFRCALEYIDFLDMPRYTETSDHLFISTPMNKCLESDTFLIDSWRGRLRRDNNLVHTQGADFKKGNSSALWSSAKLDNSIFIEDIKAEMMSRARHNRALVHNAKEAFQACAQIRLRGGVPKKQALREMSPDLFPV